MQLEVDPAHRGMATEDDAHVARRHQRVARGARRRLGRWWQVDRLPNRAATGIAHGQRQRCPSERAPEPGDGRCARVVAEHGVDGVGPTDPAAVDEDGTIGERRGALESVLGEHDGGAEIVVESHERGQHVVSALGVELRRRLVEHQRLRTGGQRAGDHAPLPFTAREGRRVAVAEVGDPERVEHLLDAPAHRLLREAEVLEHEGEVALDVVDDELRLRILRDETDDVGELARMV